MGALSPSPGRGARAGHGAEGPRLARAGTPGFRGLAEPPRAPPPLPTCVCVPDHSDTLARVQQLAKDLRTLTCQVAALKSNGEGCGGAAPHFLLVPPPPPLGGISEPPRPSGSQSTCCPVNWLEFEGSCYWFSRSGKTWPEAEKHCRLENAHLVVVNSREEEVSASVPGSP